MAENTPWMAFGLKLDDQLADAVANKDGICPAQYHMVGALCTEAQLGVQGGRVPQPGRRAQLRLL